MKLILATLCLSLALGCLVHAQDKDRKPDPTGTWKWSRTTQDGRTVESVFKLKLEGATLTGTVTQRTGTVTITNGVFKGDDVSFQTRQEASSPKGTIVTTTYTGKLSGDTITGKMCRKTAAMDYGAIPWQVKREKARP